ncbi:MAG: molybdenum cofactor guanylyltransferase [Phycisphaerales bacterium]|nr:MAG: molybdenum cofactor guanylyltransferase [Phycisphaerales bacterium]
MTQPEFSSRELLRVAGLLVGGRSRRMGQNKALLTLPDGRILIEHVVDVASNAAQRVVILGECEALPRSLSDLPMLPDAKRSGGPLAGLCSLLEHAGDTWALLLGCDMPYLAADVIHCLLAQASANVNAVAFWHDEERETYHACCALYHPRILAFARTALMQGKGSLRSLLARVRVASLKPDPSQSRMLTNVNMPEDHERVCRELGASRGVEPDR